jgi:hypothetical protein
MDVFKYFKHVRSLQEGRGAEKAAELGYQHQARSVYLDPQTGKRYKAVGDKLEPYDLPDRMANSSGAQSAEPEKDRTLSNFRKDAPKPEETPSVTDQLAKNVPGGPSATALESGDKQTVKKMLSRGREYAMSANRKAQIDQQVDDMIAQADTEAEEIAAQAAAEAEAEQAALEKEMGTPEGRVKEPEEFPTLDDKVDEIQGTGFKRQPGFTDELPSSNEEYLQKTKDNEYDNSVEFIDLKEVVDTDNIGVPLKYFDTLSRALVTKNIKDETDNWTHYGEGLAGGAGQINSQMGELMTLIFASASPEDRKKLSEVIRSQVKSAQQKGSVKKDLTVTEDWIDASLDNASAIDRYMSLESPDSQIVGGSWDQPDELQSLGIGEGGEEKGFSTDIVIRDSNGKNHQLSLKKDGNVNFLNSGAGQYTKFYLSGALEDESNPYHETAKEYFDNIDRVNEIYQEIGLGEYDGDGKLPNPSDWTQKRLKEIGVSDPKSMVEELKELRNTLSKTRDNENIVPKEYNLSEYNRQENEALETNFKRLNSEIRNLDLDKLNTPATEIFTEYFDDANFSDDIKERFFNRDGTPKTDVKTGKIKPATLKKGIDSDEYKRAKTLMDDANKDAKSGEIADKIKKIMKKEGIGDWSSFVDRLGSGDLKLKLRDKNKIMLNAILATKTETGEKHRKDMKQRERDFAKNAIGAISKDPVMKAGTLKSLRNNFPLKDVSEGSESMIIGDSVFSKTVLGKMFGTTDFNQIKDRLVVEKDSSGQPYLGYSIEIDTDGNGESDNTIPISDINVRADGLGYGQTIKHEMKLRKDFYKKLQSVNKEMGTNLTSEDILNMLNGPRKGRLMIESLKRSLRDPLS